MAAPNNHTPIDEGFRYKVVLLFSISLAIWAPIYSLMMYQLASYWPVVLSTMTCMVLVGISPFLLRRGASFFFVGNWLAFNVFWEMLFVGAYAGFGPPPFFWLAVVPMLSLLVAGFRSGLFWLITILVSTTAYYFFLLGPGTDSLRIVDGQLLLFEASVIAGLFFLVFLLSMAYENAKNFAVSALQASEEQTRKIVENAADAILTVSTDGRVETANDAFRRIFDLPNDDRQIHFGPLVPAIYSVPANPASTNQIPHIPPPASHPADDTPVDLSPWAGLSFETTGFDQHHNPVPIEVAVERLDRGQGFFVVVVRDITHRKRLEEQQKARLQQSVESFRALIENLPEGVIAHRDEVVHYANPAALRLLGDPDVHSVVGLPLSRLIPPQEWDRWQAALAANPSSGPITLEEHHLHTFDDRDEIPVESSTFAASFQNEPSLISIFRDLTERKKMRMKMMHMERMSAVGTLAAGVAHEINNPLTFVSGNLELLAEALQNPPHFLRNADDWANAVGDARQGAERIRKIVSDLRTYSAQRHEEIGPVDLQDVIETSINMAQNEIKHRATLKRDFDDVPPVLGEPAGLGQIALNLLINAAHAIPDGSAHDHQIRARLRSDGKEVFFSVSDTGRGIPENLLNRIFDPFFTTKPQDQGTGLGLAICRNIAQRFGGEISVDTEVGKGTTFTVTLPAADPALHNDEHPPQNTTHDLPETRPRVLIIDDEPLVARVLRRSLNPTFEIHEVHRTQHALDLLRNGDSFDAILCDLMMPETNGADFYHLLQQERPELLPQLIFITGGAVTPMAARFIDETDRPVLQKPIRPDVVRRELQDLLHRHDDDDHTPIRNK